MDPIGNAVLGITFLAVGASGTFLMYHLWGYPFDHTTLKSEAPPSLKLLHRVLGYVYFGIYVYFMTQMVPRLWNYQIEFPARTVAHLTLGMAIGVILIVKLSIVRFFKHLESTMVPLLGTALLVCTTLLIGLSAPFAFREAILRSAAAAGPVFGPENLERVQRHLALAGLEDESERSRLASPGGLQAGQDVLLSECIQCHDLRTVLARPRTPQDWRQTVQRMADRSTLLAPISEQEQWEVTSYLIAISPDLQKSVRERRQHEQVMEEAEEAVSELAGADEEASTSLLASYTSQRGRELFESKCSLCHGLEAVEKAPPASEDQARQLVERMVTNGLTGTQEELAFIAHYLSEQYAR